MTISKKSILFLMPCIFILSCNQGKNKEVVNSADTLSFQKDSSSLYGTKDEFLRLFNKLDSINFNIISFGKTCDSSNQYFPEYLKKCQNWTLDGPKLKKIFYNISPIDGPEWNNFYDYVPCEYDGTIDIDNKLFKYIIEAGSVVHIVFRDTTLTFGYKKTDKTLFINSPAYEEMK